MVLVITHLENITSVRAGAAVIHVGLGSRAILERCSLHLAFLVALWIVPVSTSSAVCSKLVIGTSSRSPLWNMKPVGTPRSLQLVTRWGGEPLGFSKSFHVCSV